MLSIFRALILLSAVVLPWNAAHATLPPVGKGFFINPSDMPPQLLTPPPVETSQEGRQQLASVIVAQQGVSKHDKDMMRREQRLMLDDVTQVLGTSFMRDRLPKTFALLDHVLSDTQAVVEADKNFWHTQRPYLVDHRVKLWIDPIDNSPAYPSGHTAESRVLAELLGLLFPDKLEALRARAEEIATHRLQAGVHYPVDLEGGRMLAMLIVGGLLENDDFHDVFIAAQTEITHSH